MDVALIMEGGVERVGSDSHSRGSSFSQYCFFLGRCMCVLGGLWILSLIPDSLSLSGLGLTVTRALSLIGEALKVLYFLFSL